YVNGVNQYISDAQSGQRGAKLPVEYAALQIPLNNWKATDIVATATLVQAIFATGGGNEVNSALYYESLVQRYGAAKGAQLFADFKSQNDPDARVSIPTTFNYEHVPTGTALSPASMAMPLHPSTNTFTVSSDGLNHCTTQSTPGGAPAAAPSGITVDLNPLLAAFQHRATPAMSNELIVTAAHSATGHPIAVFGPQP